MPPILGTKHRLSGLSGTGKLDSPTEGALKQFLQRMPGGELSLDEVPRDLSAFEEISLLQQEWERRANPEVNALKNSFERFLFEACWTKDEARGGRVARVPDWPFLHQLSNELLEHEMLFIEKSRRVMASWVTCCFDVWIAAGGCDPRWKNAGGEPVLLLAAGNRQVYVAARAFDQANWFLHERIKFIVEQSLAHGLRDQWPDFPDWVFIEGHARASNGSKISAVAQGADQLRGPGATLHHWEEIAFWERAKQTVEGSKPTIQGGGHIVAISTPQVASWAADLVKGKIGAGTWRS